MSNKDIYNRVEEVLEIGYKILLELEKEEPDMDDILKFYDNRSKAINRMKKIDDKQIKNLTKSEKEKTNGLFTRLQVLEKQLNRNLAMLSDTKQEALKKLDNHTKAKKSYSQFSTQRQDISSKIVDLKSQD